MSNTILTVSGDYFDFNNPEAHEFRIEDIAHALSNICRFTGHTRAFYSVAQHSVEVSYLVHPKHALAGLLHDASEAYLGDVSTHLKRMLPEYQVLEERVEAAIAKAFGLQYPLDEAVKRADLRMLVTEKRDLMKASKDTSVEWPDVKVAPIYIDPVSPFEARAMFLARYNELTEKLA